jgi:hypothetical protein
MVSVLSFCEVIMVETRPKIAKKEMHNVTVISLHALTTDPIFSIPSPILTLIVAHPFLSSHRTPRLAVLTSR